MGMSAAEDGQINFLYLPWSRTWPRAMLPIFRPDLEISVAVHFNYLDDTRICLSKTAKMWALIFEQSLLFLRTSTVLFPKDPIAFAFLSRRKI